MTKDHSKCRELEIYLKTMAAVFSKIMEDLVEAYFRTPSHISAKPYVERSLRLAKAGVTIAMDALKLLREDAAEVKS